VPFSASLLSRCNTEAHHFCLAYLEVSRPADPTAGQAAGGVTAGARPSQRLLFAPNHMWLDVAEDATCHVGLDAFAARILGRVDRVRFGSSSGLRRPALRLELQHAEIGFTFPRRILITDCNAHLRTDPQPLASDPFGSGWLFSGLYLESLAGSAPLVAADESEAWMCRETERMQHFVHEELHEFESEPVGVTAQDGGTFAAGLARWLDRDALRRLQAQFFDSGQVWGAV
jgi:glycine cleavage system H lipoate-binding protein